MIEIERIAEWLHEIDYGVDFITNPKPPPALRPALVALMAACDVCTRDDPQSTREEQADYILESEGWPS